MNMTVPQPLLSVVSIRTLKIQVQAFDESWEQLERRMGIGFAPILGVVTTGC